MKRPLRKDEKALRAVHPSAGIAALYRQKLFALIDEMQQYYVYRLRAAFRRNTPRTTLAQDADPRSEVERIIKDLLAQAKDRGSARVFLPDGTEVYFDNRPVGRKRGPQFSVRAPGDSKWTLMSGDALRTALEDVLTVPSPTATLEQTLAQLGAQWQRNLNEAAPKLASYFAKAVDQRTQTELKKILRDGGISVRFQMTPAMKDVLQSTVVENVGLIKSIGSQYHTDVQGLVMRSVQEGRDLAGLSRDLRKRYGITKRRAEFISLDQNNKSTSALMRARQTSIGIEEGIWLHSHAGVTPRPTHLANDGARFSLRDGWFDPDPKVRRRILPGVLPRCRCSWRPVVAGFS